VLNFEARCSICKLIFFKSSGSVRNRLATSEITEFSLRKLNAGWSGHGKPPNVFERLKAISRLEERTKKFMNLSSLPSESLR